MEFPFFPIQNKELGFLFFRPNGPTKEPVPYV